MSEIIFALVVITINVFLRLCTHCSSAISNRYDGFYVYSYTTRGSVSIDVEH